MGGYIVAVAVVAAFGAWRWLAWRHRNRLAREQAVTDSVARAQGRAAERKADLAAGVAEQDRELAARRADQVAGAHAEADRLDLADRINARLQQADGGAPAAPRSPSERRGP